MIRSIVCLLPDQKIPSDFITSEIPFFNIYIQSNSYKIFMLIELEHLWNPQQKSDENFCLYIFFLNHQKSQLSAGWKTKPKKTIF